MGRVRILLDINEEDTYNIKIMWGRILPTRNLSVTRLIAEHFERVCNRDGERV